MLFLTKTRLSLPRFCPPTPNAEKVLRSLDKAGELYYEDGTRRHPASWEGQENRGKPRKIAVDKVA